MTSMLPSSSSKNYAVSVSARLHAALRAYASARGVSMGQVVDLATRALPPSEQALGGLTGGSEG